MNNLPIVPLDKNQHPGFARYLQTKELVTEAPYVPYRFSRSAEMATILKAHLLEDVAYFVSAVKEQEYWLPTVAMFPFDGKWVSLLNPEGALCVEAVEFDAVSQTKVMFLMTHILFEGESFPRPIPPAGLTAEFMKQHRLEAVIRWGPGYLPDSGIGLAVPQEVPSNGLLEVYLPQDLVDFSPVPPKSKKQPNPRTQGDWREGFEPIGGFFASAELFRRRTHRDLYEVMVCNLDGSCLVWKQEGVQSHVECFNFAANDQSTYPISSLKLVWEQRPEDSGSKIRLQQSSNRSWRQRNGQAFITLVDQGNELVAYPEYLISDPGCNSYTALCQPHPCKLRVIELADFKVPRPEPVTHTQVQTPEQVERIVPPPTVLSQDAAQRIVHRSASQQL